MKIFYLILNHILETGNTVTVSETILLILTRSHRGPLHLRTELTCTHTVAHCSMKSQTQHAAKINSVTLSRILWIWPKQPSGKLMPTGIFRSGSLGQNCHSSYPRQRYLIASPLRHWLPKFSYRRLNDVGH